MQSKTLLSDVLVSMILVVGIVLALSSAGSANITVMGSTDPAYVGGTDPWLVVDDLTVAYDDDGAVIVSGGSDVGVGGSAYLAWMYEGTLLAGVTVTGTGSTWAVTDMMEVGSYGEATVLVSSGGGLTADEFWIGGHNPGYSTLAEYFDPGADLGGGSGQVTVTGAGSTLVAGGLMTGAFGDGTLDVNDGADVTSYSAWIGTGPGVTGAATVSGSGSTWTNNRELVVAAWGEGEFTVEDGASASTEDAYVGGMPIDLVEIPTAGVDQPAGTGTVLITGDGSTWDVNSFLAVGVWGQGTVSIEDGGDVNAPVMYVGGVPFDLLMESYEPNGLADGTGQVTVTGDGSTLTVTGSDTLFVGYSSTGTLDVNDGGDVTANELVIGGSPDADGTVTVDGTGATLTVEDTLQVGAWGTGTVTISGGADATAQAVHLGGFDVNEADFDADMLADFGAAEGTGTLTVTGEGSTLTVTGDDTLAVGMGGTGTLVISAGADVNSVESFIGGYLTFEDDEETEIATIHDGTGTATVTGSGSTFANEVLVVGTGGDGTLLVSSGGVVTANVGVLGLGPDATGTATVTGSGSTWGLTDAGDPNDAALDGELIVGAWGEGTLTIADGGEVSAVTVSIGGADPNDMGDETDWGQEGDPDGTGTVLVTGTGSLLEATSDNTLHVGYAGTGTLDVNDGGSVTSVTAGIGVLAGSTGTATVDGTGSTWTNTESLFVGGYGTGTLTVSGGGEVDVNEILFVGGFDLEEVDYDIPDQGSDPNGTGTVTVTGSGSLVEAQGIGVGLDGTGTLEILEGGDVRTEGMAVGIDADGVGLVTVDGTGSTLSIVEDGNDLEVPDLQGEGDVVVSNGGAVTVDGDGAFLAVAYRIAVGTEGEGAMTVSDGGQVFSDDGIIGGTDPEYETLAEYFDPNADLGDGTGTVTVTGAGSSWETDFLGVAFSGGGTLEITDGGRVTDEMGMVGIVPDVEGTVLVSGDGSTWVHTSGLAVGIWGTGGLTIEDGADVNAPEVYIGGVPFEAMNRTYDANYIPDGTGTVTVTGEGSTLDVTGSDTLYAGYFGTGTLDVNDGGDVTANEMIIGAGLDAVGTVTVDGTGSTLDVADEIVVGAWGQGTLTISGGADAEARTVLVGGFDLDPDDEDEFDPNMLADFGDPEGTGTVTVMGAGSTLTVTGEETLVVGAGGTGTLTISNAGEVASPETFIGGYLSFEDDGEGGEDVEFHGGTGTATVTGTDSVLDTEILVVGAGGDGTLTVSSGGEVTDYFGVVGLGTDSTGEVTVTGTGSVWTNEAAVPAVTDDPFRGTLVVGGWGDGTVTVADGGQVNAVTAYIGGFDEDELEGDEEEDGADWGLGTPDGTGLVTVTGDGSLFQVTGDETLYVGYSADGTLQVLNGGEVQTPVAIVGMGEDGVGLVTVDGEGSTLQVAASGSAPDIGDLDGEGDVVVSNGGIVDVNGTGALLAVANGITVGSEGEGTMTVSRGGQVFSDDGIIGGSDPEYDTLAEYFDPGADLGDGTGAVTVTGDGSVWTTEDTLMVGFSGDGTLEITDDGTVSDDMGMVGVVSGVSGTVTVSGADSTWNNNYGLVVGAWGTGELTIEDGALVTSPEVFVGGMSFDAIDKEYDSDYIPDGTGTVTVTGDGSTLEVTAETSLYVGYYGDGTLNVYEAGLVESDSAGIGVMGDSTGRVTVDGAVAGEGDDVPSEWHNTGAAFVGGWGTGYLTVRDGGLADIENTLFVGGFDADRFDVSNPQTETDPAGTGIVTVTGQGSILYGTGLPELWVGYSGDGTLDVNDGGYVEAGDVGVGAMPGSVGQATVDGMADVYEGSDIPSRLDVLDAMFVGGYGTGSLTVSDGGEVTIANTLSVGGFPSGDFTLDTASVGYDPNGTGTVTVTGEGSLLQVAGPDTVYVGYGGNGTLNVTAGGEVLSDRAYVGHEQGSEGTVLVTGEGSVWTAMGPLYVGNYGDANMTISAGGEVFCEKGKIARQEGSEAAVTVTGTGSRWVAENDIYVGGGSSSAGGTGVLRVSDGGRAEVGNEMIVWSTGTLTGDGTVLVNSPATLHNYGTIAPGNSIGTLSVEGNVVFHEGSTFEVEIANDDTCDLLDVDGNVDIQGGTVKAVADETIVGSHEYKIIRADAVTGTFDTLDTALVRSVTNADLDYDPDAVWLLITAMAFDDPNVWETVNQRAVGEGLQTIAEGIGNDVTDALQDLETVGEVRNAYDQLCGYIRPTLAPITAIGNARFMGTVGDRLRGSLRAGASGLGRSSHWATSGMGHTREATGPALALGRGSDVLGDKAWGIWGKGYGLFGDRRSETGFAGYTYRTYGCGTGLDYQFAPSVVAGLTVGYSDGQADYDGMRDESSADALHLGWYIRLTEGTWYVDGLLTYSDMDYQTDRYVDLLSEHITGEFGGADIGGYVEGGFLWGQVMGWQVSPLAGLQVSSLSVDRYTETGGVSALTFGDQGYQSVKGSAGARAIRAVFSGLDGLLTDWEVRGRWIHEFRDNQSIVDAAIASNPGVVFKVRDAETSRDTVLLGTGLNTRLGRHTQISLDYDVSLNSDDTMHVISALAEYRW